MHVCRRNPLALAFRSGHPRRQRGPSASAGRGPGAAQRPGPPARWANGRRSDRRRRLPSLGGDSVAYRRPVLAGIGLRPDRSMFGNCRGSGRGMSSRKFSVSTPVACREVSYTPAAVCAQSGIVSIGRCDRANGCARGARVPPPTTTPAGSTARRASPDARGQAPPPRGGGHHRSPSGAAAGHPQARRGSWAGQRLREPSPCRASTSGAGRIGFDRRCSRSPPRRGPRGPPDRAWRRYRPG